MKSKQLSFLNVEGIELRTPLHCKWHTYARESDFIEVEIKKTKQIIKRCQFCHLQRLKDAEDQKKIWEREKKELTDYYVRRILKKEGGKLPMHEYPQELVDIKRAALMLKAETKKMTDPIGECNKHGKLYREDVIKKGIRKGIQEYRCRKCMKELHKQHYQLNKLRVQLKCKEYKRAHPDRVKQYRKKELASAAYKRRRKKYDQKARDELKDFYVKEVTAQRINISKSDIPDSLTKTVREHLRLKRLIKSKVTGESNEQQS